MFHYSPTSTTLSWFWSRCLRTEFIPHTICPFSHFASSGREAYHLQPHKGCFIRHKYADSTSWLLAGIPIQRKDSSNRHTGEIVLSLVFWQGMGWGRQVGVVWGGVFHNSDDDMYMTPQGRSFRATFKEVRMCSKRKTKPQQDLWESNSLFMPSPSNE